MSEEKKEQPKAQEEQGGGLKQIAIIFAFCMLGDLLYRTFANSQKSVNTEVTEPVGIEEQGYDVAKEISSESGHKRLDVSDEGTENPKEVDIAIPE